MEFFALEVGESTMQAPTKHAVSFKKALTSLDRGLFKKANRRGKISNPIITVQDSWTERRGKEGASTDQLDLSNAKHLPIEFRSEAQQ